MSFWALSVALLPLVFALNDPIRLEVRHRVDSQVANIHITIHGTDSLKGILITYGQCDAPSAQSAHHEIHRYDDDESDRLIWRIPESVPSTGCLSAWAKDVLVGRSQPIAIDFSLQHGRRKQKRQSSSATVVMDSANGIDSRGPWFDGVAALEGTHLTAVASESAKSKQIGIVGAGMAGLMTWLVLNEAGMANITILEASQRLDVGHSTDRELQMGPMRFPQAITYADTNETIRIKDHQIVSDLVEELNRRNAGNRNFTVSMIPFINSSPNGIVYRSGRRKPNGELPTVSDVAEDPSLEEIPTSPGQVAEINQVLGGITANQTFMNSLARNIFAAHKQWLTAGLDGLGGDSWSEFAYLHNYLKYAINDTLIALSGPFGQFTFWDAIYESFYFGATEWATIDGGLNRLPAAFHPLVDDAVMMNAKVQQISYNNGTRRVNITFHNGLNSTRPPRSATFDYAVLTPPLPVVRSWRLPAFSSALSTAIHTWPYDHGCKAALQFRTRFWEHLDRPIYGSCSTSTDTPGIGQICYPSYDVNSTGPGVVLASYITSTDAVRWLSASEDEYITYALNALAEIHGPIVYEQYTGNGTRYCWLLDPYEYAGWAQASVGMRQAFLPDFFRTEQGCILSGEATSFTSSWIASALESGIRAAVQLLLQLGLVDEAKVAVEKWMARWIEI
ncbi:uncharacterized protein Z518_05653 [Rhinocladiella mackenziei CBS 650.93]|uniref:Amine oxidase domain-containing protein n=1 Tax=Rhinocladiella mackenziei CBS 650.93 TaxID=1442369 RepID=A0A0D2FRH4_9EURO|nr:uncharacterized protein Z518_05653 [Rhinocladiella mackenziei CBS 650.93]KIX04782.1 hypothetical protein Z518_05653 [Rhinocladiella mackenziei CBS 650.93]